MMIAASPSSSSFGMINDREKLLNAKEIQLREHELELIKQESRVTELCNQLILWRDECIKIIEEAMAENIVLPEIPVELQALEKSFDKDDLQNSSDGLSSPMLTPINPTEEEELMFMIEESTKTRLSETELSLSSSLSEGIVPPSLASSLSSLSPQASAVPTLIEPLTKPPEREEVTKQIENSTSHLITLSTFSPPNSYIKTHRKSLSMTMPEEIDDNESPPKLKVTSSQSDGEARVSVCKIKKSSIIKLKKPKKKNLYINQSLFLFFNFK